MTEFKVLFLSTEQFWEAMCDIRFVRLSLHQGSIGSHVILTDKAPEEVAGFIVGRVEALISGI